jgi:hypothetical protein
MACRCDRLRSAADNRAMQMTIELVHARALAQPAPRAAAAR